MTKKKNKNRPDTNYQNHEWKRNIKTIPRKIKNIIRKYDEQFYANKLNFYQHKKKIWWHINYWSWLISNGGSLYYSFYSNVYFEKSNQMTIWLFSWGIYHQCFYKEKKNCRIIAQPMDWLFKNLPPTYLHPESKLESWVTVQTFWS